MLKMRVAAVTARLVVSRHGGIMGERRRLLYPTEDGPNTLGALFFYGFAGLFLAFIVWMTVVGELVVGLVVGGGGVLIFGLLGLALQRSMTEIDESGITTVRLRRRHWTWDQVLALRLQMQKTEGDDFFVLHVRDYGGWHRTAAYWHSKELGLSHLQQIAAMAPRQIPIDPTIRRRFFNADEVTV
jgi:hypothetical protein